MRAITQYAVILFCMLCGYAQQAKAQSKAELEQLSNELYKSEDDHFVVIDAYKDGYLKWDKPYRVQYFRNRLLVNGEMLHPADNKNYIDKINRFMADGHRITEMQRIDIFGNDLRAYTPDGKKLAKQDIKPVVKKAISNVYSNPDSALISELCADKLILKTGRLHIRYSTTDCYVNNTKVDSKLKKKFIQLAAKANDATALGPNDFMGLSYTPADIEHYCGYKPFER